MSKEDFEAVRELAKQNHADRVAKTPDRVIFAQQIFKKHGIQYVLKNESNGHFHAYRKLDGALVQF